MKTKYDLDQDLTTLRQSLHEIDDERIYQIQQNRNRRDIISHVDGRYDFARLLNGLAEDRVREIAPYEWEVSQRLAEAYGRQPQPGNAFVPVTQHRDANVAVAGQGGFLASTQVAPGDLFANFLYAADVFEAMSVTRIRLTGNASVPRISGNISTSWQAVETGTITESQFAFAAGAASPKTVGAYFEASRQALLQMREAASAFVMRHLALATANEMANKFLNGDGTLGRPLGVLATSGIGSIAGTNLGYSGVLDIVKSLEDRNGIVDPRRAGFVIAPDAGKLLRSREKATGSGMIMTANDLAGYPVRVTKQIADGSLVFADWSQVGVFEWGQLEIGTDPYGVNSALFKAGLMGIRSMWSCDCLVLNVDSVCKSTSIT